MNFVLVFHFITLFPIDVNNILQDYNPSEATIYWNKFYYFVNTDSSDHVVLCTIFLYSYNLHRAMLNIYDAHNPYDFYSISSNHILQDPFEIHFV